MKRTYRRTLPRRELTTGNTEKYQPDRKYWKSNWKQYRNKEAGPDGIVLEMHVALDDFNIHKITEVINLIYNIGVIPDDLSKSIFISTVSESRYKRM